METAADSLCYKTFKHSYNSRHLKDFKELYLIAGENVCHSLSPQLHNAAFNHEGREALFLALSISQMSALDEHYLQSSLFEKHGFKVFGLTVAAPFKSACLDFVDRASDVCQLAESANNLSRSGHGFRAQTSDDVGVLKALQQYGISLKNLKVLIVGGGGTARVVAVALQKHGAQPHIMNHNDSPVDFCKRQNIPFYRFDNYREIAPEVIVSAVPGKAASALIKVLKNTLKLRPLVIEHSYKSLISDFLHEAVDNGCDVIGGMEILMHQVEAQFTLLTGGESDVFKKEKIISIYNN